MGFSEFKWPPRKVPSWKIVHLVFVPIFFGSHYTCGGVRKRFWGKNFQGRPKKKKSKKVNKILFPFPFPFPVIPKNGGLWFPFPNFGNGFFHSLPVPEFRECFFLIPFPFPNPQKSFPLTPALLQTIKPYLALRRVLCNKSAGWQRWTSSSSRRWPRLKVF